MAYTLAEAAGWKFILMEERMEKYVSTGVFRDSDNPLFYTDGAFPGLSKDHT